MMGLLGRGKKKLDEKDEDKGGTGAQEEEEKLNQDEKSEKSEKKKIIATQPHGKKKGAWNIVQNHNIKKAGVRFMHKAKKAKNEAFSADQITAALLACNLPVAYADSLMQAGFTFESIRDLDASECQRMCFATGMMPDDAANLIDYLDDAEFRARSVSRVRGFTKWEEWEEEVDTTDDEKRGCTDVAFLLLFMLMWIGIFWISAVAWQTGQPARLIYGTNAQGETCGTGALRNKTHIYYPRIQEDLQLAYMMNPSKFSPFSGGDASTVHFYGVCVDKCPKAKETVCSKTGQCWTVDLDTVNVLFRCIAFHNVTSWRTIKCVQPLEVATPPGGEILCYSNYGCTQELQERYPGCTLSEVDLHKKTQKPAKSSPVYDLLMSVGMVFLRWFGDLMISTMPILVCGGAIAFFCSLAYILTIRFWVKKMVWFTIGLTVGLLIFVTTIMAYWGGLMTNEQAHIEILKTKLGLDLSDERVDYFGKGENMYEAEQQVIEEKYYKIACYVLIFVDFAVLGILLWLRKHIAVAVAMIAEASRVINTMPLLLLFPIIPSCFAALVTSGWVAVSVLLASTGDTEIDMELESSSETFTASQEALLGSVGRNETVSFFNQAPTHYMLAYVTFGLLWSLEFIKAVTSATIAGAVSDYYWKLDKSVRRRCEVDKICCCCCWDWCMGFLGRSCRKMHEPPPILMSLYRTLRYHAGSMALGSLLIALVQAIRIVFEYIDAKTKKQQKNSCMLRFMSCCFKCCLRCFDRWLRFISRQAFILIAVKGTPFCKATRDVFSLLKNHLRKIATVHFISCLVFWLGRGCVVIISALSMFALLNDPPDFWLPIVGDVGTPTAVSESLSQKLRKVTNPTLPLLATSILAYSVASYCFSVFEMTVETLLLCFCEDLEVNKDAGEYFMSAGLLNVVEVKAAQDKSFKRFMERHQEMLDPQAYQKVFDNQQRRSVRRATQAGVKSFQVTVDSPPGSTMVVTIPEGVPGAGALMELVVPAGTAQGTIITLQVPLEFDGNADEEESISQQLAGTKIAV
jgi:choline transporter-like protein 2/4/5